MANIVIVTGTPGAGKTTVLNEALRIYAKDLKVINYGDAMLEAGKKFGIKSRDEIRKLLSGTQRELQKSAADRIAKAATGITIVDTHSTISTPEGYLPGLPEWVVKALSPRVIILIEADSKDIAKRRKKDETRERDAEAIETIELQQDANRMAAFAYAALTGATVKIIKNRENKLDMAAEEFVELLRRLEG